MAEISYADVLDALERDPALAKVVQGRLQTQDQGYQNLSPELQGQLAEYSTLGEQAKLIERLRARGVDKENTPMPTTTMARGMPVADMGGGINAGLMRMQGASERKKADGLDAKNIQKKIDTHFGALQVDQANRKLKSDTAAYNGIPSEPAGALPRQDPIQQWQGGQYDPATGANRELTGDSPIVSALRGSGGPQSGPMHDLSGQEPMLPGVAGGVAAKIPGEQPKLNPWDPGYQGPTKGGGQSMAPSILDLLGGAYGSF
jgi:hypothetical protein